MSGWPVVALSEVFEIARGGSPRPIDDFVTDNPDGINWITISDASEGSKYIRRTKRRIRPEGAQRSREVKPGDFLLTNSMSFGRPYIMRTSGCIHDGWLMLSPRRGDVDADFFYHLLGSKRIYSEFERRAAGATVKNLNIEIVRDVKVPLPPLPEQRRIAAILDKADELRAKRRAALAQLNRLPQAMFLAMFGDPISNSLKWDMVEIDRVCRRITVGIVVQPASYYRDAGVPALRSLNIRENQISTDNLVYFSSSDNEHRLSKTRVWEDDVLLVRSGQPGTAAVVPRALSGVNAIDILIATPDKTRVHPTYLCCYFNSEGGRRMVLGAQRGQIQKHLNVGSLKAALVQLPPIDLQCEFARRVQAAATIEKSNRTSVGECDNLFASLQHQAFSGAL